MYVGRNVQDPQTERYISNQPIQNYGDAEAEHFWFYVARGCPLLLSWSAVNTTHVFHIFVATLLTRGRSLASMRLIVQSSLSPYLLLRLSSGST